MKKSCSFGIQSLTSISEGERNSVVQFADINWPLNGSISNRTSKKQYEVSIIRLHHMHAVHACSLLLQTFYIVCFEYLSVCLHTTVICAKTAESTGIPTVTIWR